MLLSCVYVIWWKFYDYRVCGLSKFVVFIYRFSIDGYVCLK